jgi:phospholipase D
MWKSYTGAAAVARVIAAVSCALLIPSAAAIAETARGPAPASVTACFTPAAHCADVIAGAIDRASREIRVQAYYFTSVPILRALADAKRRGVDVEVILDRSQDRLAGKSGRYTSAVYLAHAGIPVWIDAVPGIAHNKVVVIDGRTVLTGSFNFTRAADERNAENVVLIEGADVATWFLENWQSRQAQSGRFETE